MRPPAPFAAAILTSLLALTAPAARAEERDPATVVTAADVAAVLGSRFELEAVEPGIVEWNEESSRGYRVVEVYLRPANGSLGDLHAQLLANGEEVEELTTLGDAIYRPQGGEAMAERRTAAGEAVWLSIRVANADDPATTRKLAVRLLERAVPRL